MACLVREISREGFTEAATKFQRAYEAFHESDIHGALSAAKSDLKEFFSRLPVAENETIGSAEIDSLRIVRDASFACKKLLEWNEKLIRDGKLPKLSVLLSGSEGVLLSSAAINTYETIKSEMGKYPLYNAFRVAKKAYRQAVNSLISSGKCEEAKGLVEEGSKAFRQIDYWAKKV